MLVYWTACIMSMLFTTFCVRVKHEKTNVRYYLLLSFFSALPLIFIASIRYDVGMDYCYTYLKYFRQVQSGRVYSQLEILYHLLNVLVVKLHGDFPWVFALSAIIFFTIVYYKFFQDSPNVYLSIFLLVGTTYLFIFFNAMRQLVGCSIVLLSLRYARERKLFKFLLIIAIAAGFHWSCAVFAVVYFISNLSLKPRTVLTATVCVFVGSELIARVLKVLIGYTKYAGYLGSRFDTGDRGLIVLLINFGVLLFATAFSSEDPVYRQYYNLQIIASWIEILTGNVVLINRMRWMFGLPVCILIPMALANISTGKRGAKNRLFAGTVIVVLYFIYASYAIGVQNGNSVLPYRTVFSLTTFP